MRTSWNDETVIRAAEERDLPVLSRLLTLLFELEQDFRPDPERQIAGLRLMLNSPRAVVLVAKVNGQIAGLCGVQCIISTAQGAEAAVIEDLVLFPEFRRKGLGSRLLAEAERWARARGIRRVQLHCDDLNQPALDFYRKNHWEKTHLIPFFKFL